MDSLYTVTAKKIFNLTEYLEENLADLGKDAENIHQVRVASRKIRATLPVLKNKIEKNRYKELLGGIKNVTKTFGSARDLDVQILYLEEEVKEFPDIKILLEDRRIKRAKLDKQIKKNAEKIRNGKLLKDIKKECKDIISSKYKQSDSDFFTAYSEILFRLKTVKSLERTLKDPSNQSGHHMLRIAIKKLRYSLENFTQIYEDALPPIVAEVKKLQTVLGDLHDLDVWIELSANMLNGKEILESEKPLKTAEVKKSLEGFSERLGEKRGIEFEKLVATWNNLKENNFFENILETMSKKLPLPDFFVTNNSIEDFCGLTQDEAENFFLLKKLDDYGINPSHSKNVAEISLKIFDKLKKLHNLGELEKRYLKFGAILHDIGWSEGMKGHNKISMKLIMEDEELPLNTFERILVGNIARYHRKFIKEKHWNFEFLDQNSKIIVKKLASLLRLADAMDLDGKYTYKNFDFEIYKDKIRLVFPKKPIDIVLNRIVKKKDVFEDVYEKKLEVYY